MFKSQINLEINIGCIIKWITFLPFISARLIQNFWEHTSENLQFSFLRTGHPHRIRQGQRMMGILSSSLLAYGWWMWKALEEMQKLINPNVNYSTTSQLGCSSLARQQVLPMGRIPFGPLLYNMKEECIITFTWIWATTPGALAYSYCSVLYHYHTWAAGCISHLDGNSKLRGSKCIMTQDACYVMLHDIPDPYCTIADGGIRSQGTFSATILLL